MVGYRPVQWTKIIMEAIPPMVGSGTRTDSANAREATLSRSVRLFRAFLKEQSDPDYFYQTLATDSVSQISTFASLEDRLVLDVGGGPGYFADGFRTAG